MSMMNPVLPNTSAEIARIAFSLFVHVADIDRNITPQEVRRFQVLLNDTSWVENEDLKTGLLDLKERYSSFWSNYEDRVFSTDAATITDALERVQRYLGDERARKLKVAFGRFLVLLDRGSFGVKLGQKDNPSRIQAKKELASLLLNGNLALPATIAVASPTLREAAALTQPVPSQSILAAPGPSSVEDVASKGIAAMPVLNPAAGTVQAAASPKEAERPVSALPAALAPARTARASVSGPHPRPDEGNIWSGRMKLTCVSISIETPDTKTYSFVGEPGTLFHYQPGQAVTIEIPLEGSVLRRTYTISSSPSRPHLLSITVKKVPLGWMSNWLFDNMVPGVECMASGPAGKFTCVNHKTDKLLFLSAGSGVTPVMSMLRWLSDMGRDVDIVFIYNVSTPVDIIFHQELLYLSTRFGNRLRLVIVPVSVGIGFAWHGSAGRISEMLIRHHVPDVAEREAFVCGPSGYMTTAKTILTSLGLPTERYHQEAFGAAKPGSAAKATSSVSGEKSIPISPPVSTQQQIGTVKPVVTGATVGAGPAAMVPTIVPQRAAEQSIAPAKLVSAGKPQVILESTGQRFSVSSEQTILEAADAAGVHLDHSCRAGNCGSCKMRRTSGKVEMAEDNCLSPDEIESGCILTCVARLVGQETVTLAG